MFRIKRGFFKKIRLKKVILFLGVSAFVFFFITWLFLINESVPGHKELKFLLMKRLIRVEPLTENSYNSTSKSTNILYVLGGSHKSLKKKFKTAADLYSRGLCEKMLLLSEPGITEYDPLLGRNLTNDEWAINKLVDLGVKKEDIEPILLKKGVFGTFTEAKGISDIALKRGYNHLILVTSSYHTMRTWVTFSKLLDGSGVTLYIYASDESVGLRHILLEYVKLKCYESILLPAYN